MDGFVITAVDEETSLSSQYWDGTNLQPSESNIFFFKDRTDARRTLGQIQSIYSDVDLKISKAKMVVRIAE